MTMLGRRNRLYMVMPIKLTESDLSFEEKEEEGGISSGVAMWCSEFSTRNRNLSRSGFHGDRVSTLSRKQRGRENERS